jgi:hypothetical protein
MDAIEDLKIGDIHEETLLEIWRGNVLRGLREEFLGCDTLNETCRKCSSYVKLDAYRARDGRDRARVNRMRSSGEVIFRGQPRGYFSGG